MLALEAKGAGKSRLWRREIMSRVFTYLSRLLKARKFIFRRALAPIACTHR